ncbi:MAG TPA: hypothetical protein VHL59_00705 [Thermoanaerobaculia bacterium]|nr:hypothetical protein [Thermoanaerobaculia bacterium]
MKKPALVLLIAGAVVGGLVAVAGGIGALIYFGGRGFGVRPPTAEEKKLVVTASMLADRLKTDPRCETVTFKHNFDGSREIEAEYDSETCGADFLSFNATAEIAPSLRDARQSFALQIGAFKAGARVGGGALHDAPGLLKGGDQRWAGQLKHGTTVVGNAFVLRQGRVVHALFIVGIEFDDAEETTALFAPLLAESERQFGGKRT